METDISAATLEPVYLDPSSDAFRYVDLGVISIGGETFSYDTVGNTNLNTFGISIQSAVFDPYTVVGETKSILYFDSMSLVPAENYVYAKLSSPIGGETGAEIYARDDGSSYGLVVERIPGGRTIDSLVDQSVLGPRNVIELIPIVDSADWNMPTDNSKIILVAGNDTGNKTTAQAKIDLGVISRTVGL